MAADTECECVISGFTFSGHPAIASSTSTNERRACCGVAGREGGTKKGCIFDVAFILIISSHRTMFKSDDNVKFANKRHVYLCV